jgi:hypothetical protein
MVSDPPPGRASVSALPSGGHIRITTNALCKTRQYQLRTTPADVNRGCNPPLDAVGGQAKH